MGSTAKNYPARDPQLFYELARDRLNTQLSTIDALDNKIGLLFSLASGLLGILAAVFAVKSAAGDDSISTPELLVLAAAGVAYCFVAYAGIKAYFTRSWKVGPELGQVWADLWRDDDALLKWKVANDFWSYYDRNLPEQKAKEDALPMVFAGVVIETVLLVLALFLVAVGT